MMVDGNHMKGVVSRFVFDDTGQDLLEYALLTAIISVTGLLLFSAVADGMSAAYTSWESAAQEAWEPCPPAPASCP